MDDSGRLSDAAMERALGALAVCADKIGRRGVTRIRAVATQACRAAANGEAFLDEVARRTGLRLSLISPLEEAQLSVAGCLDLLDKTAKAALVLDVGGGSTELSWVDLTEPGLDVDPRRMAYWRLPIRATVSIPLGVVTLAERFPEAGRGRRGQLSRDGRRGEDADPGVRRRGAVPGGVRRGRGSPRRHVGGDHQPGGPAPRPAAL